jgi:hypothetical protein
VQDFVLTNMAFTYGVHRWEISTPQVFNSTRKNTDHVKLIVVLGVYNPVDKAEFTESFEESKQPSKFLLTLDLYNDTLTIV